MVFGRDASPVAVVECKRPDVDIDKDVLMQAAHYNLCLGVRWVMLTNGKRTVVLKMGVEGGLKTVDTLPQYAEM